MDKARLERALEKGLISRDEFDAACRLLDALPTRTRSSALDKAKKIGVPEKLAVAVEKAIDAVNKAATGKGFKARWFFNKAEKKVKAAK